MRRKILWMLFWLALIFTGGLLLLSSRRLATFYFTEMYGEPEFVSRQA